MNFKPLKYLGILSIILGIAVSVITYGYLILLGLIIIGTGFFALLLNHTLKFIKSIQMYFWLQIGLSVLYLLGWFVSYQEWNRHNLFIFPDNFNGEAAIIFGIEGYPELSPSRFWRRTIEFPDNGIIITSTLQKDIPLRLRTKFSSRDFGLNDDFDWDANYSYHTILTDCQIDVWLFSFNKNKSKHLQDTIVSLANRINDGTISCFTKSNYSPISKGGESNYLNLQNHNISALPRNLEALKIKKAILTGNNFTEIPSEILEVKTLTDLLIGHNPLKKLPANLSSMAHLKCLSLNAIQITDFPEDLSPLKSLESLGFDHNNLQNVPLGISTLPSLKDLGLNDNQLKSTNFITEKYSGLKSIHLYSNRIDEIGCEFSYLINLEELLIFDNKIDSIPDCIGQLTTLEKLEIWNNPICYISPEIKNLTNLKYMLLDDDFLTKQQKDQLVEWLPNCHVKFQTRSSKGTNAQEDNTSVKNE